MKTFFFCDHLNLDRNNDLFVRQLSSHFSGKTLVPPQILLSPYAYEVNYIQSNLSSYSLYYAEAYNKLSGPISRVVAPMGTTTSVEEMLPLWRAVGNTVFDSTERGLNLGPTVPEAIALPLDQLAG